MGEACIHAQNVALFKVVTIDVNARSVRSRLTVRVHRIKLKVQKKQWNICPQETSHIQNISLGGVYCAENKSRCKDLNFDRQCICDSCKVWKEYGLKDADPNNHFCQH
ncbi:DUF2769 domain-containing protein [Methanosarcina mazei]|uniref:DUF2769 domain-containing protein n=1 Tax=Methanosarcina mazei TaxID=2209 RepID=UPI001F482FCB|nr:DUF2769 domain-containing protein [Methanosarcina mazei]